MSPPFLAFPMSSGEDPAATAAAWRGAEAGKKRVADTLEQQKMKEATAHGSRKGLQGLGCVRV